MLIGVSLSRKYQTMERAYVQLDSESAGFFTYGDLADKLIALGAPFSRTDLISLAEDIDTDNDQKISKVETFFCDQPSLIR